uniref:Metallo-beta-lactamase domain-containing protein n=1 Tax=Magnetococcus massalia (strain MO-1) TaxID=451514 RepID=A0A1S7LD00_MAGMO|nr:Conserved protein of unknown function [Candidatus Magnetococcus massalia]
MSDFHQAMPHGPIEEIFQDLFFVTGTMKNEFFGSMWQFSRNMTIVREGDALTLINSVRLDDEGLAALDALGKVTHIVRMGDMHGLDDPFYLDRYNASFWALPEMTLEEGLKVDKVLKEGGELPFGNSSLFAFNTVERPEAIIRLEREGGIMIACDALQNWLAPDPFFDETTAATMTEMGFFTPANLGPAWMMGSKPQADDFARLKEIPFRHALCGHGAPLRNSAQEDFHATFKKVFNV